MGGTATELWSSAEALAQCDQNRNATNLNPSCTMEPSAAKPPNIRENSSLYNGMINPWVNTAVRGMVWCESSKHRPPGHWSLLCHNAALP